MNSELSVKIERESILYNPLIRQYEIGTQRKE